MIVGLLGTVKTCLKTLDAVEAVNKEKIPLKKDSLKQQPSQGKVTIPIDWDYIIDKYIKNTNTNAGDDEVLPNSDDEFY